jgi:eukaryotic-like serine/threonine-protein kinase
VTAPSQPASTIPYAEQLLGRTVTGVLTGNWTVVEKLPRRRPGATGGLFSAGYIVEDGNGTRAYLKALDLSLAARSPDPTRELQALLAAFNFERDLLTHCRDRKLDRVVRSVDHGQVTIDPILYASLVPFIVFELADGDVRSVMGASNNLDTAWALRSLHQVATGVVQLHRQSIAHQDIKPSNVMLFASGADAKVGDLGRASLKGASAPHEALPIAGDKTYAPPELLYDDLSGDWQTRRFGCDAYLLGSLVVSLYTGVSMTGLVTSLLPPGQHWRVWKGSYTAVLPFVRDAFNQAVASFAQEVPAEFRGDLERIVRQLCDPDPTQRGHPRARAMRHGNPFELERYVSQFDLLARRAERGLRSALTASSVSSIKPGSGHP